MVRQLFSEPWFGVACTACALFAAAMMLACLPVWRVNDATTGVTLRITLVDALEANRDGDRAARLDQDGRRREAAEYWRASLGLNPVHRDHVRGALLNWLAEPQRSPERRIEALRNALVYMLVSHTNAESLDLLVETCESLRAERVFLEVTRRLPPGTRHPGVASARLRAMFSVGAWDDFDRAAAAMDSKARSDRNTSLYLFARTSCVTNGPGADMARRELEAAAAERETRPLALRLLLETAFQRQAVGDYGALLGQAEDFRQARVRDHVRYWLLLEADGRRNEAVRLARDYNRPPESPEDLDDLVNAFVHYGWEREAERLMDQFAAKLPAGPEVWAGYAEVLLAERRFVELRAMAAQMRATPALFAALGGFSLAMDAIAVRRGGDMESARSIAAMAARLPITDDRLALHTADKLINERLAEAGRDLLLRRTWLEKEPSYWVALLRAGREMDDTAMMVRVARKRAALEPSSAAAEMDLCAALLCAGQSESEALALARRVFARAPYHPGARLNYAMALLENHESQAALNILDTLAKGDAQSVDPSSVALTRARAEADLGYPGRASESLRQVNRTSLTRFQRDRADQLGQRIKQELGRR